MTRTAQHGSPSRVFTPRPAGIPKKSKAPFWRGERAEDIVQARKIQYDLERANRPARGQRSTRTYTPTQRLRRLERALKKRKTLAAQQRIQAEITTLRRDLGLPERREDRV